MQLAFKVEKKEKADKKTLENWRVFWKPVIQIIHS